MFLQDVVSFKIIKFKTFVYLFNFFKELSVH